jgi:hypothetical protein
MHIAVAGREVGYFKIGIVTSDYQENLNSLQKKMF